MAAADPLGSKCNAICQIKTCGVTGLATAAIGAGAGRLPVRTQRSGLDR